MATRRARYTPLSRELSPSICLVQAATILDIMTQRALDGAQLEELQTLKDMHVSWLVLVDEIRKLGADDEDFDEDDEEDIESKPIGFQRIEAHLGTEAKEDE